MTFAALVRAFVMPQGANSIRSSFFLAKCPFRLLRNTLAANNAYAVP